MSQALANYSPAKRVGGIVYASGIVAVDPIQREVITRYEQLPDSARAQLKTLGFDTGQLSVDVFEAPIVAQSYVVLQRIQALGAEYGAGPEHVARLVQYFRDLRHYPAYNRVRSLFYPAGVVSTVVEVSRLLPNDAVLIEVEATFDCG